MLHRSGGMGARAPLGKAPIRGGKAPTGAVRIAAPWPPCGWARPFSGREQPIHDADRRAYRRLAAAFSLDLETAFWKRTVTTSDHHHPAGISTCVHPLHQPVAGRPHVVGASDDSRGPRRLDCWAEPASAASLSVRMRLMRTLSVGWDGNKGKHALKNKSRT